MTIVRCDSCNFLWHKSIYLVFFNDTLSSLLRDSFTKFLKTNPLVRAIASDSKMAQRFNKMVEEAIDFEEHLQPHKEMLLELAKL
mmetsp:Transcript_2840/g.3902  ORF Transcript_2840/g.3902 Transcript_2840/m.3902 type:complete len:85 (+) Transcript_2840:128-382(+)